MDLKILDSRERGQKKNLMVTSQNNELINHYKVVNFHALDLLDVFF